MLSHDPPLLLPPLLDLTRADALHAALQARIAQDLDSGIDGSAVERVGTACMQLLVAARISARARGRALPLLAASTVLAQAAHDLGLTEALGLSAPAAGETV